MHNTQQHYAQLAETFDQLWQFSPDYEPWMVEQIQTHLALQPHEHWVDFGAGTGRFSQAIHRYAQPASTLCVEPDAAMCAIAQQKTELMSLQACDQTFVEQPLRYDALLVKEVIHHLSDRLSFWRGVKPQLNPNGRILLITRPQETTLALFEQAKARFAQHQPSIDLLCRELQTAGFDTQVSIIDFPLRQTKSHWYTMLRAKFMSDLVGFSEDEIEAGIIEVDKHYPGEWITHADRLLFVVATNKKQL
ncbi:MAG: class I SAM-dependent methyltransferase [Gammaproteobacteria bacterium]|nr:class I SAM-dependent methyltransferase [Gammaproteobacteria bacterium]